MFTTAFGRTLRDGICWHRENPAWLPLSFATCDPSPCAQTARPTFQSHLFPSTRLALSRLRGLLAVPPVLAPRQNSARRRDPFPDGPTAPRSAAAESTNLHRRRPGIHQCVPRPGCWDAHYIDVYPQWNIKLPDQVDRNALQLHRQGDLILAGAFHVGELLPVAAAPVAPSLRVLKPGQRPAATSPCSRQQIHQPGNTRETTAILL